MSYILQALRYNPLRLWPLDDSLDDISSYRANIVLDGDNPRYNHIGLAYGSHNAVVVSHNHEIDYGYVPVYQAGMQNDSFSIAVNIRPIESDGTTIGVFSHLSNDDGLVVDGNIIRFRLAFADSNLEVDYDLQIGRNAFVIVTFNGKKLSMYVDGILVAENAMSEEQFGDTFYIGDQFEAGGTTGTGSIALGPVAVYGYELNPDQIRQLAFANTRLDLTTGVGNGGFTIKLSEPKGMVDADKVWSDDIDWLNGEITGVGVLAGQLSPIYLAGEQQDGQWLATFPTNVQGVGNKSVVPTWDGEGVQVQFSFNGTTWQTVERGTGLDISTQPNPIPQIRVRVKFDEMPEDQAGYLDYLRITSYKAVVNPISSSQEYTVYSNAYPNYDYPNVELRDDWGARVIGGTVGYENDIVSSGYNYSFGTAEFWIKPLSDTTVNFPLDGNANTYYINGLPTASLSNLVPGEWALVHIVGQNTLTVSVAGTAQVGQITTYKEQYSADQVLRIYEAYMGSNVLGVSNSDTGLSVTQTSGSADLYKQNWSVVQSG